MPLPSPVLSFEQWLEAHEDYLTTKAAELGALYPGFDCEAFAEQEYGAYIKVFTLSE